MTKNINHKSEDSTENITLLKIKLYIYGESLAAAGCQWLALNLRPAMVTVKWQ